MSERPTIAALRRAARSGLTGELVSADAAAGEADILIAHALDRPRSWLFAHSDEHADIADQNEIARLVAARRSGVPIAQLTGKRGFWTFELAVDANTLIPRPETELLVELALARIPNDAALTVADLGTGSGAIAIALGLERPRTCVVATDIHDATLNIANANAAALGASNVEFRSGSWCSALGDMRQLAMIVSNPPYIEDGDSHLLQGDLRFEPRRALASGADGLDAIRSIISDAPIYLNSAGWLLLEHGLMQGETVRELMITRGFGEVSTALDLEQRERVTLGRWMSRQLA